MKVMEGVGGGGGEGGRNICEFFVGIKPCIFDGIFGKG